MKKLKVAMALCVVGTLVGTVAWAGYKNVLPVTVDVANRTARGSLGDARISADAVQYSGCRISTTPTSAVSIYGVARDANGVKVSCNSSQQNFVQAASTIQPDSILMFDWDASNQCTALHVDNFSSNTPK